MKILDEKTIGELTQLAQMEADIINKCFEKSQKLGLTMLNNSIGSFAENYLKKIYGNIVLSMCSEYRFFILELTKIIDKKFQDAVISELLIPQARTLKDTELFEQLIVLKNKTEISLNEVIKKMVGTKLSINKLKPSAISEDDFKNYLDLSNVTTCDTCRRWMILEQSSYSGNYCLSCLSKV